jgi:O-antigen ligase
MIVVFMALGPSPVANLSKLGLAVVATLPVLLATDIGSKIIDYLPWVGEVDARNVDGRARLAEVAFQVFLENPVFGRFDYLVHPAMEALRGSDGIIDTVNTYVVVGLRGGGVGLALFVGVFATAAYGVFRSLRRLGNKGDERHALGRALLATLVGVLLIIGTVSPILVIPTVYWILAGLAVGYSRMIALDTANARVPADGRNRAAVRRFAAPGAVPERPGVRRL